MNEQLINDRIKLDNINSEMNKISQVAREYMNATPEQRNRVNPDLLASVLDRYNMLKADKLALEQSVVAREMEAQRAAMEQPQQQTYNGWGRRRTITPRQKQTIAPNHDYSKDQSFLPGMSMRRDLNTSTPEYDARYDVNSPEYVYNKTTTNLMWQTSALPEFANTYWKYDAWWRLVPQNVLNERAAYNAWLSTPWEKLTWLQTRDLMTAAAPALWGIVNSIRWLSNLYWTNAVGRLPYLGTPLANWQWFFY